MCPASSRTSPLGQLEGRDQHGRRGRRQRGPDRPARRGRGGRATASAVMSDVCDIAAASVCRPSASRPRRSTMRCLQVRQPRAYYLRMELADSPARWPRSQPCWARPALSIDRMRQYVSPGRECARADRHAQGRAPEPRHGTGRPAPRNGRRRGAPVALRHRGRLTRRARWTGPRPSTSTANGFRPVSGPSRSMPDQRVFPAGGTGRCACRPAGGAGPARALGA